MDLLNFTTIIQLAVVFNFAFVVFDKQSKPISVFTNFFENLKNRIYSVEKKLDAQFMVFKDQERNHPTQILENENLPYEEKQFLFEELRVWFNLLEKAYKIAERIKNKVNNRLKIEPIFLMQTCVVLGLYGIVTLFIVGLYKDYKYMEYTLLYLNIGIILFLICYFLKEIYLRLTLDFEKRENYQRANLRPILFLILIVLTSFLLSYFHEEIINRAPIIYSVLGEYENRILNHIKYFTVIIPFLPLICCFIYFALSGTLNFIIILIINMFIHLVFVQINSLTQNYIKEKDEYNIDKIELDN